MGDMQNQIHIPNSLREAGRWVRVALAGPVEHLPKHTFINAWCSLAYLYPGLHPDGFEDPDSGWPPVLRRFAAEAWRRADVGELEDEELYCSDPQWSGLYDRMFVHTPEETARRLKLAAEYGGCPDV